MLEKAPDTLPSGAAESKIPIRLFATVNLLPEITRTVQQNAEAVGLYRSEFLELAHRSLPTEEEQCEVYRKMLRMLDGRSLTLRTLDLRAEKLYGLVDENLDPKQAWDWRLVDRLPRVQSIIRTQLRAAIRAAQEGPLRILFPMITSNPQFECALRLLAEARESLLGEGFPIHWMPPIGVMVEAPVAALRIPRWAPRVDFVCIGSNDLMHSYFGVERLDDSLMQLKTPLEPGFLKVVRHIVLRCHAADRQVTICGEAASQPWAALAFHILGADALSLPPDDLPKVRRIFYEASIPEDLPAFRRKILAAHGVAEVHDILAGCFPHPAASLTAR
jgi:phosphoenolpyruvate-protein kinase (PTS system EI component)